MILLQAGTFPRSKSSNFILIEIILISATYVSSRRLRRNNSPAHETIFSFSCRRPETLINYQSSQRHAAKRRTGSLS